MKYTVTIGIPAYNEMANISNLITCLSLQQQNTIKIIEIIVLCDGSTDGTVNEVKKLSKSNPLVKMKFDGKRKGKTYRLNQLFKIAKGNIIVALDADLLLESNRTIQNLISPFRDKNTVLAAGNKSPKQPKRLIEKIIVSWYLFFYEIRKNINSGNNIYNITAAIFALRKSFARNITIPSDIYSIAEYLYFTVLNNNLKFSFVKDSVVLYKAADNFSDFMMQTTRTSVVDEKLFSKFDEKYRSRVIPTKYKVSGMISSLKISPFILFAGITFLIYQKIFPFSKNYIKNGVWKTAKSTKISLI